MGGVEGASGLGSLQSYPGWLPKGSRYVSHGPCEPGDLRQSLVLLAFDPQQLVLLFALAIAQQIFSEWGMREGILPLE